MHTVLNDTLHVSSPLAQPCTASPPHVPPDEELHMVMVPYPLQGHINPMIHFANTLITQDRVRVSFVNIKHHHDRIQQMRLSQCSASTSHHANNIAPSSPSLAHAHQHEDKLQFLWVDNGLPPDFDYSYLTPSRMRDFHLGTYSMKDPLKELLQSLNQKSPPISCVLFGSFCPWVHTIAAELEIPSVFFWTQSASALSMYYHMPLLAANGFFPYNRESPPGCDEDNPNLQKMVSYVPGVPPLPPSSFPTLLHLDSTSHPRYATIREQFTILPRCQGLIVNSFEELEKDAYQALQEELPFPVSLVGPLNPLAIGENKASAETESLLRQEIKNECIDWLDSRRRHSVLYISFGTLFNLSVEDLESIANGLKASNYPFLWVIRPTSSHLDVADILPKGFIDDTKEQGLIVPWAPQVQVLSHSSVGAFLTHCGWNSTMESVSMGVPMIPCPIMSDQPTNCTYVCDLWKVGVALRRHADECITSEDVERVLRTILEGREGDEVRKRAIQLREAARKATQAQGSSSIHTHEFIQGIRDLKRTTTN